MGSYLHKGGNFQKRLWVAANITWKWLDCQDCWEKEMSIAIALPNFSKIVHWMNILRTLKILVMLWTFQINLRLFLWSNFQCFDWHIPEAGLKKTVRKNFRIFIKKPLFWSLFWRLQHRWCFLVNIAKFMRTPCLKNICKRLFLLFEPSNVKK